MRPVQGTVGAQRLVIDGTSVRIVHRRPEPAAAHPPVVILHGWGASLEAIEPIVQGLAGRAELLALDLPGFGESDPPTEGWSVADYGRFVLRACDEVGIGRFSLVGHSFGARIAIVLGATAPERIDRIVLTGAAGIKPRRTAKYYSRVAIAKVGRVVGAAGGAPGRRVQERMRRRVASTDWLEASETMRQTFRLVIGEDLTPLLPQVRASTLLIWGDADADTPLWMGQRMEGAMPDAGLVVLKGGHYVYAERSGEFNAVVAHFLVER